MVTPALSVRALSKRFEIYERPVDRLKQTLWRGRRQFYRDFWALRDVGFALAPGQVLGVIGRNGSGKSTLLQIVAGTLSATSGDVELSGRVAALLELGSGFSPEFTGRENVFLNGAILGLPHAAVRELMPELLAFADIGDFIDRPVKTYSSGMALRLAFAVATAAVPRILIVDEALAVGDEAFQRKCFARIERMRDTGTAVLFVSHSPLQILELCDQALLLDGGEMLMLDEPGRVVPEYQRMLYATHGNATALRQRLRAIDAPVGPSGAVSGGVSVDAPVSVSAVDAPRPVASFDPDLRSASVVEYAQHGARIGAPRIVDEAGEAVNVLVRGGHYAVLYDVTFLRPARRVRYGMMIKSTSGLELGGAIHPPASAANVEVAQGARMSLRFEFPCRLFAGMYFLNVGLWGEVDGTDTFLHRLVDVIAFRVEADPSRAPSGYVDFGIQAVATPLGVRADD